VNVFLLLLEPRVVSLVPRLFPEPRKLTLSLSFLSSSHLDPFGPVDFESSTLLVAGSSFHSYASPFLSTLLTTSKSERVCELAAKQPGIPNGSNPFGSALESDIILPSASPPTTITLILPVSISS
jgi:hypothetical protein